MVSDSTQRYGNVTRFLHWAMALLIVLQFLKLGDRIDDGEHWVGQTIVPWHISIGLLLLTLVVLRLLWALAQRRQRPGHVGFQAFLVKAGHFLLYVCMFLMPLTGLAAMLGGGYGLSAFGITLVAETGVETPWLADIGELHEIIAFAFLALAVGHIVMALYHHFVRRDGLLLRMMG
ncbi:MAG: cytochrome b [Sphingomonadaceae bacterium]